MSLGELRRTIEDSFDLEELRSICFDSKIPYENLDTKTKQVFIRELLEYCHRRKELSILLEALKSERPDIPWEELFEPLATEELSQEDETASNGEPLEEMEESSTEASSGPSDWWSKIPKEIWVGLFGLLGIIISSIIAPLVIARLQQTPVPQSITPTSTRTVVTATNIATVTVTNIAAAIITATFTPSMTPTTTTTLSPTIAFTPLSPTVTATTFVSVTPSPTATPPVSTYRMLFHQTLREVARQPEVYGEQRDWRQMELCVANRGVLDFEKSGPVNCDDFRLDDKDSILLLIPPFMSDDDMLPREGYYQYDYTQTQIHEVVSGDTFWDLANFYYGNGNLWPEICVTNRDVLTRFPHSRNIWNRDCGQLEEGQQLRIPLLTQFVMPTMTPTPSPTSTPTVTPMPSTPTPTVAPSATSLPTTEAIATPES